MHAGRVSVARCAAPYAMSDNVAAPCGNADGENENVSASGDRVENSAKAETSRKEKSIDELGIEHAGDIDNDHEQIIGIEHAEELEEPKTPSDSSEDVTTGHQIGVPNIPKLRIQRPSIPNIAGLNLDDHADKSR